MYQDTFNQIKSEKEHDENEANRLFHKYKYLEEDDYKYKTKESSKEFDVSKQEDLTEDEILSTDMSDPEYDYLYKRYKLAQLENK